MFVKLTRSFQTGWPKGYEVQTLAKDSIVDMGKDADAVKGVLVASAGFLCDESGNKSKDQTVAGASPAPEPVPSMISVDEK